MGASTVVSRFLGATVSKNTTKYDDIDWTPLLMSLIAGMSTCLGAVWVFCKKPTAIDKNRHRTTPIQVIRPSTMSFSLALAGSVMVTVSVVSIIPECLRAPETVAAATTTTTITTTTQHSATEHYEMISIFSAVFLQRLFFHVLGYFLYFLLAKFAFPEPDEILGFTQQREHADEEEQEGLLMVKTEARLENGDVTTGNSTPPAKEHASEKARLRRFNDRQRSKTSGDDTGTVWSTSRSGKSLSISTSNDSDTNTNNIEEGQVVAEDTGGVKDEKGEYNSSKPSVCLQKLTRYSSGADLETSESKRAWRVAMLLFLSLAFQ